MNDEYRDATVGMLARLRREFISFFQPRFPRYAVPGVLVLVGAIVCLALESSISSLVVRLSGLHEVADATVADEPDVWRARLASRLISQPVAMGLVLSFSWFLGLPPITTFGLSWREWKRWSLYGICLAMLWAPWILGIKFIAASFVPVVYSHPAIELFSMEGVWDILIVVLVAGVLAPMTEELLFRGLLQNWLATVFGRWPAILIAAFLFGLAHMSVWPDPIPLFVLGVALGLALFRTGSLWTPIMFHASFNLFMLGLLALEVFRKA